MSKFVRNTLDSTYVRFRRSSLRTPLSRDVFVERMRSLKQRNVDVGPTDCRDGAVRDRFVVMMRMRAYQIQRVSDVGPTNFYDRDASALRRRWPNQSLLSGRDLGFNVSSERLVNLTWCWNPLTHVASAWDRTSDPGITSQHGSPSGVTPGCHALTNRACKCVQSSQQSWAC